MNDLSEKIIYEREDLPLKTWKTTYIEFPTHWHNETEFALMSKGCVKYNVNGENIVINEGDALFVKGKSLHYGERINDEKSEFTCLITEPYSLLGKTFSEQINALYSDSVPPFIHFSHDNFFDRKIILSITEINQLYSESSYISMMSSVYRLYDLLLKRLENIHTTPSPDSKQLEAIKRMVGYIQNSYSAKMTVDDIAAAGLVCRSSCCNLFRSFLGKSPVDYLTEYRIYKAADMLRESDISITEICLCCGFSNSSYFTKVFGEIMGTTPREYRKSARK